MRLSEARSIVSATVQAEEEAATEGNAYLDTSQRQALRVLLRATSPASRASATPVPFTFQVEHGYTGEVLWRGIAGSPMGALDAFAEAQGFVPYSELAGAPNGDEWVYDVNGETWAIFLNHEVRVRAVTAQDRRH